MSREALSLDISAAVARVVNGEPVDAAEHGAALAAKYPDLGMSGDMIGEAIVRAAGMVGMIKSAPAPTVGERKTGPIRPGEALNGGALNGDTAAIPRAPGAPGLIEDDIAAAIDSEIGEIVARRPPRTAREERPLTGRPLPAPPLPPAASRTRRFDPAALLRGLFRH